MMDTTPPILDRQQLLAAPAADYMNEAQLAFFKELLQHLKQQTMLHVEETKQRLGSPPDISDEIDRAQYEEESRLLIRMLDRERKLLPKIDQALRRIARKEFGYCLERVDLWCVNFVQTGAASPRKESRSLVI